MRPLATALGAAALLLAPLSAHAQYAFSASYNVLDIANRNGATLNADSVGRTTGQERGIAYRPAIGADPAIVYIGRGGIGATDNRPGGVIGISAIKLSPYGASNYTDTGLITSGGSPAAFSFIQGITYDPVCDKVWVADGASATSRVWRFDGGAVGGDADGGTVAAAAPATGIASVFQASNASALGGTGRGIAVRVSGTGTCASERTVTVALAMGNHLEVWRSTAGLGGTFALQFESATDPDGSATTYGTFSSTGVRSVAFDENGDVWIANGGSTSPVANRNVFRYSGSSNGTGVLATESFGLAQGGAWNGGGVTINGLAFYREGGRTFLLIDESNGAYSTAATIRYSRSGSAGSYSFTALDGFGQSVVNTGNTYSDATLATSRYVSNTSGETTPRIAPNGQRFIALPYSSTGDLTLTERAIYQNSAVTDASKGQSRPTSGIVKALLPPNVTIARYYDGSSMGYDYGTNDNPFLGLTATTDRSTSTLSSIIVRRTQSSTATDSDTGDLKLWLDTNGDGAVDEASSPLATATMTGGVATFSGLTADATTTGTHLLITVSIPAEAPPAAHRSKGGVAETAAAMAPTFGIEILAGDIVTSGGASTVGGTGTLAGSEGSSQLPVELVGLSAASSARGLVVAWTTASETGNAGFGIEVARVGSGDFREVAFVSGRGTTSERTDYRREIAGLAAGRYHVRLRQVDVDGAAVYHGSVEAAVALADAYALGDARPTPTSGTARLALTVRDDQHVRAEVYDLVGRRVAVLHDGAVTALAPLDLVVDGGVLPQGTYVVRVAGEHFSATRRLVVTR